MQLIAMRRVFPKITDTLAIFPLRVCICLFFVLIAGCGISDIIPDSDALDADGGGSRSTYVGAAVSFSNLEPDASDSTQFSVSDTKDSGFGFTLGRDYSSRLSFEARLGQLGSATLSPVATVDYAFAGVSGVYYPLGDEYLINRREGLLPFVRGGINYLIHDASVFLDQEDNFQLVAGVGVDFTFTQRLGVRAELNFHDVDALAAHFGVLYRFSDIRDNYTPPDSNTQVIANPEVRLPRPSGQRSSDVRLTRPPVRLPNAGEQSQSIPQRLPEIVTVPEVVAEVASDVAPEPLPQVVPNVSRPISRTQSPPVSVLRSGVLKGVRFATASAILDIRSRNVLDQLAVELRQNPTVRVELQSHTDGVRGADFAIKLSRARVSQVGRYLLSRAVSANQLSARAFGSRRPLFSDITAVGNNRLELQLLTR